MVSGGNMFDFSYPSAAKGLEKCIITLEYLPAFPQSVGAG